MKANRKFRVGSRREMGAVNIAVLIIVFITIVIGLGFTPKIMEKSNEIQNDANASDEVKTIAPYIPLFYVLMILGIPGAYIYKLFKTK